MIFGYGRGSGMRIGCRGGSNYGFRGDSSPWPYTGRGRGGLSRCRYPGMAISSPYHSIHPFYYPRMTSEDELDWLKSQAGAIKAELNRIEARMQDIETSK